MAEAIAERVRRYVLDGSDEDLRRLLSISQVPAEAARRAGNVRANFRAVFGCGSFRP